MNDKVDKAMKKAVSEGVFPSASLLVAKDGDVVHRGYYGAAREGTCFDVASLTKPVCTATLVNLLAQEGLLKLSDTVFQWLGGAREPHHKIITVEHLLNHTSGLPAWQPYYRELPLDLISTPEGKRFILDACYKECLVSNPGEKLLYSDIGYIILGEIVGESGGAPLDELFLNRVSAPLGFTDTFFVRCQPEPVLTTSRRTYARAEQHVPDPRYREANDKRPVKGGRRFAPTEDCPWRERVIHGEVHDQNAYALGGVAGHAGLFSTADDLNRFALEFVKGRRNKDFIDFDKKGYVSGWDRPWVSDPWVGDPSPKISAAGHYFSKRSIGHLAYTGCSIWMDLERYFWIILLTNRIHPSATNEKIKAFRPKIHDLIFEELINA